MDCGDIADVHPIRKKPLAYRAADKILHYSYKRSDIIADQPLYDSVEFSKNTARIKIKNADGLFSPWLDGVEMYLADEKHELKRARLTIEGDTVIAVCDDVEHPTMVRYGFDQYYRGAHIYNCGSLPLAPFRSDTY